METAVAYLRQSVARQKDARDGGSVSTAYQLDAVRKWCAARNVVLIATHQDVDESGASSTRKGLDSFIADVRRLRPTYAVMWDIKRLVRSMRIFLDVFDALQQTDTELVSCTEGTRHPAFVWKMLVLFAEEERERIAVNITHGKREATKRGRHVGYAPLGYLRDEDGALAIDEETAWIVRWLFDRALDGHTVTAICRMANERGLPTPGVIRRRRNPAARLGAMQWSRSTVEDVLRRPTYAGLVVSGASSRSTYGKRLGVVRAEGTHAPIIERRAWEAVQVALDGNGLPSAPRGSWHWLQARVFCAACGSRLYYVDSARSDGNGRDRYWRCRRSYAATFGRAQEERCPSPRTRIADRLLTSTVRDALYGALTIVVSADNLMTRWQARNTVQDVTARELAERDLADLQAQRIRINDFVQMGTGDLDDLGRRDREIVARMATVQTELAALPIITPITEIAAMLAAVSHLRAELAAIDDVTPEQWAHLAVRFGLAVTVDLTTGALTLTAREPYDLLLGA